MELTHWSMGQLATYADAPASYLRTLPPELAASCINNGLAKYDGEDVQFLVERDDGRSTMRAMTTAYSRLWNADVVRALKPATEPGWMVPPHAPLAMTRGHDPPPSRTSFPGRTRSGWPSRWATISPLLDVIASDRDMFVFLVNPDGSSTTAVKGLMRGVFVVEHRSWGRGLQGPVRSTSKTCAGTRLSGGRKGVQTLRVVHKGNNFQGIGHKLGRELRVLADANTTAERDMVSRARSYVLGKDRETTVERVHALRVWAFPRRPSKRPTRWPRSGKYTAKAPPVTAWGFCHGLTRFSQSTPYADERNRLDMAAGKILQIAYTAKS